MSNDERQELRALLKRTRDLPHLKRVMVMLYGVAASKTTGAVDQTAQELAEELGIAPTAFSRARRELIDEGWLDQVDKHGQIRFYGLSDKALGRNTVVQLRA